MTRFIKPRSQYIPPLHSCTYEKRGRFWDRTSNGFAYVLNLLPQEDALLIESGFLFPTDWDYIASIGERDTSIRLRVIRRLRTEEELHAAMAEVETLRSTWFSATREELKAHIASLQKAFLQRITAQLKPLGFRKKPANWTFQRGGGYEVVWNAQKSLYSDSYYFNLYLHRVGMRELYGCICTRPMGELLDWQTVPEADFSERLRTVIEQHIRPLMTLPLSEIAQNPTLFGKAFLCTPRRCADCWYPEENRSAARTNTCHGSVFCRAIPIAIAFICQSHIAFMICILAAMLVDEPLNRFIFLRSRFEIDNDVIRSDMTRYRHRK